MGIHGIVIAAQRFAQPFLILAFQIPFLSIKKVNLFEISLLDIFVDLLHKSCSPFP